MHQLRVAVLTVSDSRSIDTDTSGSFLAEAIVGDGHLLADREIVVDDVYLIRAIVSKWIADKNIDVIVSTGGTGFSGRDSTPEALVPLFDKEVDGFGELFRQLSYEDIGTSTVQSRAIAGMANATVVFALPGSTGACRLAWDQIIREQLDASFKPCNFAELIPRLRAK